MDVTLALQRAVRGFPHGAAALAAVLGTSVHSLNHKVSPQYPSAHCSPDEMLQIMEHTGDHGALLVMCDLLGYVPLLKSNVDATGLAGKALVRAVKEFGELAARASASMEDGRVTANELARLEREGTEAIVAIQQLLRVAQGLHGDGARR